MDFSALVDASSLAIVLGGTAIATALRSGRAELCALACLLGGLTRLPFCPRAERATLAVCVTAIQRSGVHRLELEKVKDGDLLAALGALVRHRSFAALEAAHRSRRAKRLKQREDGLRPLQHAGDLAPVFGLVGTLVALSQRASNPAPHDMAGAVAMAVLTTLYGVLLAQLVLLPLARMVERRGQREEFERDALLAWLGDQLRDALPASAGPSPTPATRLAVADREGAA